MRSVFISSTSVDLVPHRAAVRDAVLALGMHPIMMEYFPAMDANAVEACRRKVLESDLLIGIYAHRYGYIPQGQTRSITEMEYDWAVAAKIPRQIFVVTPDYVWPDEYRDSDETLLNDFKKRVGIERVWSEFTTPESLAAKVSQSLAQNPASGSQQQRQQRNLVIVSVTVLAVLLLIAVAIMVASSNAARDLADRNATNVAVAAQNATATATQWTPTPTSTPTPTPTPPPLPGGQGAFNVIVAGFGFKNPDGTISRSQAADQISDVVADSMSSLPGVSHVANRQAPGVPYILNASVDARAQAARAIAQQLNASVVVYGLVSDSDNEHYNLFAPEFYVAGNYIAQEADFVGNASFGTPVNVLKNSSDAASSAGTELQNRLQVLRAFVRGLSLFIAGDFSGSQNAYQDAISAIAQEPGDQSEISALLHVLTGNAALRLASTTMRTADSSLTKGNGDKAKTALSDASDSLDRALEYYSQALHDKPNYARALVGRGFGLYQLLLLIEMTRKLDKQVVPLYDPALQLPENSRCDATEKPFRTQTQLLALLAFTCFSEASKTADQPPLADIDVKTEFGEGQINVWLALHSYTKPQQAAASTPLWNQAQPHLQKVVDLYRQSDADRQERTVFYAAYAEAWLGLQLVVLQGANVSAMQKAAAYYTDAIALLSKKDINLSYNQALIATYTRQLKAINDWLARHPVPVATQPGSAVF